MADDEKPDEDKPPKHEHESLGERLHDAEEAVEDAVKDAVARIENRVILASEAADLSPSSEVNLLTAMEVAVDPPEEPDEASAADETAEKPKGV